MRVGNICLETFLIVAAISEPAATAWNVGPVIALSPWHPQLQSSSASASSFHTLVGSARQQQKRIPNTQWPRSYLSAVTFEETDATAAVTATMTAQDNNEQESFLAKQQQKSLLGFWSTMDRGDELISKAINAAFLAASFGCAIYAILHINQGMTRGWTQSEIAMRIPLDTWSSYEAALEASPVATKTIINVIIYLLGDWFSQTVFAKRHVLDFDLGRTLRNGFIGLCFGPLVHEYYQFSDAVLPVEGGLENRIAKIIMDQTIYLSVKCSVYIMAVNTLSGESLETSAQAVKDKLAGIVVTAWKFWPLIHCITYSVIPARHRILWVNCVDLVWNAILASMSQKQQKQTSAKTILGEGELNENLALAQQLQEQEEQPFVAVPIFVAETSSKTHGHGFVPQLNEDLSAVESSLSFTNITGLAYANATATFK